MSHILTVWPFISHASLSFYSPSLSLTPSLSFPSLSMLFIPVASSLVLHAFPDLLAASRLAFSSPICFHSLGQIRLSEHLTPFHVALHNVIKQGAGGIISASHTLTSAAKRLPPTVFFQPCLVWGWSKRAGAAKGNVVCGGKHVHFSTQPRETLKVQ